MNYNAFVDARDTLAFQLGFLARAVSNETRLFMTYLHVEPSDKGHGLLGVATDGRRLHLVDPLDQADAWGVTPGFWRVLKTSPEQVWIARVSDEAVDKERMLYPPWRRVVPVSGEGEYKTVFSGFSFRHVRDSNYSGLAKFINGFPEISALNLSYLADLGTGFEWNVEWYGRGNAVKFTEENRTAVIMTIQGV